MILIIILLLLLLQEYILIYDECAAIIDTPWTIAANPRGHGFLN